MQKKPATGQPVQFGYRCIWDESDEDYGNFANLQTGEKGDNIIRENQLRVAHVATIKY